MLTKPASGTSLMKFSFAKGSFVSPQNFQHAIFFYPLPVPVQGYITVNQYRPVSGKILQIRIYMIYCIHLLPT
jgi:hypothetical protein